MRLVMIGSGYVGLVTGACLADFGHDVVCVDKDAGKIATLERGEIPIFEPGLKDLVPICVRRGLLRFTTDPLRRREGRRGRLHRAWGTPSRRGDGYADLSYVHAPRGRWRGAHGLRRHRDEIDRAGGHRRRGGAHHPGGAADLDFSVVSNPEFLREGAAIEDFKHPDRIVVGANDQRARDVMAAIYRRCTSTRVR